MIITKFQAKNPATSTQEDKRATWKASSCECKSILTPLNLQVNDTIQQQEKEQDVQTQINRVIALGFLSEGYLDCRLKDPDIQQRNGYIDQLRLAIVVEESSAVGFPPVKRVRAPERLAIPAITPRSTTQPAIPPFTGITQINPNLSRKSDKSLLGFDIAVDIDSLVKQSMKLKWYIALLHMGLMVIILCLALSSSKMRIPVYPRFVLHVLYAFHGLSYITKIRKSKDWTCM